jgi:membrane protein required for colicin V production
MNSLDIALLVVMLFFLIRGIFRGFIKEMTGVAGVIAGFVLANRYYPVAADAIKPFLLNEAYRDAIGFLIIFLVVFIVVGLVGLLLDLIIKLALSKTADGLLGGFIGVVKGVVLSAVVLMTATAFIGPHSPFFSQSQMWPYVQPLSQGLKRLVPEDLQTALNQRIKTIKSLQAQTDDGPEEPSLKIPEPPPWEPVAPPEDGVEPPPPAWPGENESNS